MGYFGRFGGGKRIDKVGAGLLALLIVLASGAAYAAIHFGWFRSPWEMAAWAGACLAFVLVGLGGQSAPTPKNTNAHGSAKPASEGEAQAAARGETKAAPMHQQTFPD